MRIYEQRKGGGVAVRSRAFAGCPAHLHADPISGASGNTWMTPNSLNKPGSEEMAT